MDMNTISTLVGTVGFPILAYFCIIKIFTQNMESNSKNLKENTEEMRTLTSKIDELLAMEMQNNELLAKRLESEVEEVGK